HGALHASFGSDEAQRTLADEAKVGAVRKLVPEVERLALKLHAGWPSGGSPARDRSSQQAAAGGQALRWRERLENRPDRCLVGGDHRLAEPGLPAVERGKGREIAAADDEGLDFGAIRADEGGAGFLDADPADGLARQRRAEPLGDGDIEPVLGREIAA